MDKNTAETGRMAYIAAAVADVVKSTSLLPVQKEKVNHVIGEFLAFVRGMDGVLHAKHSGDGFIIFGVNPQVVVEVALAGRDRFRTTDWRSVGLDQPPKLRIGLDAGMGRVGTFDNLGHEATGDGIEGAARLEPVVEPGQVWCSEGLFDCIKLMPTITGTHLGEVRLAKNAGARRVVALRWAHEAVSVSAAAVVAASSPPPSTGAEVAGVYLADVPLSLLRQDVLSLIHVQVAPCPIPCLEEGRAREETMHALKVLFEGHEGSDPGLDASGDPGSVVVFPEFAFDVSQWGEVDSRVRARTQPLVLIAGFGPAGGNTIRSWQADASSGTRKILCLSQDEALKSGQIYNGGWCWVHDPAASPTTQCFCFIKNFREQNHEVQIVTGVGRTILALRFKDLLVLPAICADLIQEDEGCPQSRFRQVIAKHGSEQRVLVVGSLWDPVPWNTIWTSRLDSLATLSPNLVTTLVNRAFDRPREDEGEDGWRARTGVFVAKRSGARLPPPMLPFIRSQETPTLLAGVARHSRPTILYGRVSWPPYGSTIGKWFWEVTDRFDLTVMGPEHVGRKPRVLPYELHRFLRRTIQSPTNSQKAAIDYLESASNDDARRLVATSLIGVGAKASPPEVPWNHDAVPVDGKELLSRSAQALCQLGGSQEMSWCDDRTREGQLQCVRTGASILVWSGEKGKPMMQRLREWTLRSDGHPSLVVVGYADDGLIDPGPVVADRLTDYSSTPADSDDFTETRGRGFATVVRLHHVMDEELDEAAQFRLLRQGLPE